MPKFTQPFLSDHMNRFIIILMLFQSFQGNAQKDPHELNLNRFFLDWAPTFGMYKPIESKTTQTIGGISFTTNSPNYGGGMEFKTGNNWYLRKGKFCGIFQLTWIRLGLLFSDGLYAFASPANIGIGHHFQLNKQISITTSIHSGILFVLDDLIQGDGFVDYFILPEIKLNIGDFALGFEYSPRRRFSKIDGGVDGHYHYLGLSIGGRFGRL